MTIKKSLITVQTVSSLATLNVSCIIFETVLLHFCYFNKDKSVQVTSQLPTTSCVLTQRPVTCSQTQFGLFHSTVGGWFLPGQSPICPSSSPPQFSGTAGHSSGSYCERYSSLRSHRAAPYPSHYPHRTSSTSKTPTYQYIHIMLSCQRRNTVNGRP